MKKKNVVTGLTLTVLIALMSGGMAHAKTNQKSKHDVTKDDTVLTQNHRQKTRHSERKAAAVRLKAEFKATEAARIVQPANAEQGNDHKRGSK